jgi:AcrR family transcriptional regulator
MVRAATQIIWSDGPAACTIDEVARRSGVARTTIYRHFGSSDALVLAVVDGNIKQREAPDTGSLRGDLRAVQLDYGRTAQDPAARRLFTWMMARSMEDPVFAAQFRRVRVQPGGPTVVALQRAIARGEVDPELDLGLAVHLIQGPFLSKQIIENEELTDAEFEVLLDRVVRSLVSTP